MTAADHALSCSIDAEAMRDWVNYRATTCELMTGPRRVASTAAA